MDSSKVIVSLDAVVDYDEENDASLYETIADENQNDPSDIIGEKDLISKLTEVIKQLPEREQTLLSLYYYEELTLSEIGTVLGVSESRACQLHARAVMTLQALLTKGENND
jgi:RNA polymerase sigma factor for flagellar operon FliA